MAVTHRAALAVNLVACDMLSIEVLHNHRPDGDNGEWGTPRKVPRPLAHQRILLGWQGRLGLRRKFGAADVCGAMSRDVVQRVSTKKYAVP